MNINGATDDIMQNYQSLEERIKTFEEELEKRKVGR